MEDGREAGYVLLHRQVMSSAVWTLPDTQFKAWCGLLLSANWKDGTVLIQGEPVVIRRGQVLLAQRQMADRCRISRGALERAIAALTRLGMVTTQLAYPGRKPSHNPTILTVCNYEKFQPHQEDIRAEDQAKAEPKIEPKTGHQQGRSKKGRREEGKQEALVPLAAPPESGREPPPPEQPTKKSPQAEAFDYWRETVWPVLSSAPCPDPSEGAWPNLARLCRQHGVFGVKAAMDRAVAIAKGSDPRAADWILQNLTLECFCSGGVFARFQERNKPAVKAVQMSELP